MKKFSPSHSYSFSRSPWENHVSSGRHTMQCWLWRLLLWSLGALCWRCSWKIRWYFFIFVLCEGQGSCWTGHVGPCFFRVLLLDFHSPSVLFYLFCLSPCNRRKPPGQTHSCLQQKAIGITNVDRETKNVCYRPYFFIFEIHLQP